MRHTKRLYHRTDKGERALRCYDRRLPRAHRTVLARIEGAMHSDRLLHPRALAALEAQGFVESVPVEWLRELYRLGCYEPTPLAS